MSTSRALLLDIGIAWVAVAPHRLIEILSAGPTHVVPWTPSYCQELLDYAGRLVPVMSLGKLIHAGSERRAMGIAVLAYQPRPRAQLMHGALRIQGYPRSVAVDDAMVAPLPEPIQLWSAISISCFGLEGRCVPIIDPAKLFQFESATYSFVAQGADANLEGCLD